MPLDLLGIDSCVSENLYSMGYIVIEGIVDIIFSLFIKHTLIVSSFALPVSYLS